MNNYLSEHEYEFIYSRVPRICVDLIIINTLGEILLTKRDIEPYKDHWHFPGGRIKFKETAGDATNRILRGELGQKLNIKPEMVGFCEFLEEVQNGSPRHSISLVHLIKITGEIQVKLDNNAREVKFFASLPDIMIPPQKDFIIKYNIL